MFDICAVMIQIGIGHPIIALDGRGKIRLRNAKPNFEFCEQSLMRL
jgi:hypothetical protein